MHRTIYIHLHTFCWGWCAHTARILGLGYWAMHARIKYTINSTTQHSRIQSLDLWLLTAGSCLQPQVVPYPHHRWSDLTSGHCSQQVSIYMCTVCSGGHVILHNSQLKWTCMIQYVLYTVNHSLMRLSEVTPKRLNIVNFLASVYKSQPDSELQSVRICDWG